MSASNPSDEEAFPDVFKPIPVSPEVLAEFYRTFNREEVEEEIRKVQDGGGLTYEQCVEAMDALMAKLGKSSTR